MISRGYLLTLDTATRTPVLGLASSEASLVGDRRWTSLHRHGEQLLSELDQLLREAGARRGELTGIGVGIGPGSFTGLRIGLATAKVLAHALGIPLVGVPTTHALALAAGVQAELAITLPAGVADRYVHRLRVADGEVREVAHPQLVAKPEDFAAATAGAEVLAVDLEAEDVTAQARELGEKSIAALAAALSRLAARELSAGRSADIAALVPAYVALPRGIAQAGEEMVWSPDLR